MAVERTNQINNSSQLLNDCLNLLDKVDPKVHSLTVEPKAVNSKSGGSKYKVSIENKNFLVNFIRWFIHLVTCKHFPVNAKLDLAVRSVINAISEIEKNKKSTDTLKNRSIKNLKKVLTLCEENDSCETAKVRTLIDTIRTTRKIATVESQQQLKLIPEQPEEPEPISLSPLRNFAKKAIGSLINSAPIKENSDEVASPIAAKVEKHVQTDQIPEIEANLNKTNEDYPEKLEQLVSLCEEGMKDNALLIPKTINYSIELADLLVKTNEEAAWPHYLRALKICKQRGGSFDSNIQPLENKLAPIFYKLIDQQIQLLTDTTTPVVVSEPLTKLLENVLSIAYSNDKYILYSAAFFDVFSENLPLDRLEVSFSQKLTDLYKQNAEVWDKMVLELNDLLKNKTDFILQLKKRIANKYYSLGIQLKADTNKSREYLEKAYEFNPEDALTKESLFKVYLEIIFPANPGFFAKQLNRLSWSPGKEHIPMIDKAVKLMPDKFGTHIQKFIVLYETNNENKKAAKLYRKWSKEGLTINDKTRTILEKRREKTKKTGTN